VLLLSLFPLAGWPGLFFCLWLAVAVLLFEPSPDFLVSCVLFGRRAASLLWETLLQRRVRLFRFFDVRTEPNGKPGQVRVAPLCLVPT
jgi:hypothetical protein